MRNCVVDPTTLVIVQKKPIRAIWYNGTYQLRHNSYMYTLYVKSGCPFCEKVLRVTDEYNISIELKELADDGVADELIARGGKRQVPYLVDNMAEVAMYESGDIIAYLMTKISGDASKDESGAVGDSE